MGFEGMVDHANGANAVLSVWRISNLFNLRVFEISLVSGLFFITSCSDKRGITTLTAIMITAAVVIIAAGKVVHYCL